MTEKGIEYETVNYLKDEALSETELKHLLHAAALKPQYAIRKNEPAYKECVADKNLTDDQLIHVMTQHPELIQRPMVMRGSKAVLARPSEKLAELGTK